MDVKCWDRESTKDDITELALTCTVFCIKNVVRICSRNGTINSNDRRRQAKDSVGLWRSNRLHYWNLNITENECQIIDTCQLQYNCKASRKDQKLFWTEASDCQIVKKCWRKMLVIPVVIGALNSIPSLKNMLTNLV